MSEEKIDQASEKFHKELAETISKSLNIPVFVISQDIIRIVLEE